MNEDELRALVRAAIARRGEGETPDRRLRPSPAPRHHASHAVFALLTAGADDDGPCLIESAVMCNHCGYCRSYGH